MLEAQSLLTMQDGFRASRSQRAGMEAFVRAGGIYKYDASAKAAPGQQRPIAIERVPDGACYIADGLHRVVSICVARRSAMLHDMEYLVKCVTYDMYLDIDLSGGWFTPFDPRIEVRLSDLSMFKQVVRGIMAAGRDPSGYIRSHKHLYCRARTPDDTIASLVSRWKRDGGP